MKAIKRWLDESDSLETESLRINWNLTERVHRDYAVFVYVEPEINLPVGYLWPDFGILEVKPSHRGQGIGQRLVNYGLDYLLETGDAVATIHCAPESSIPFWKKMGFEFYVEDRAFKIIPKKLRVPKDSQPVDVRILFYPERKMWDTTTAPLESFSPKAFIDKAGKISLSERVTICTRKPEWNRDPVISIYVDGHEQYTDKAKRQQAGQIGVEYTGNSYSVEWIDTRFLSKK
jgi:hypothetical protein